VRIEIIFLYLRWTKPIISTEFNKKQMSQIRTLTLLALAVLFLSTHSMLAGGSKPQDINQKVIDQARSMMISVSGHKLFEELESSQLIYYASQMVAGTNHYMVWEEPSGEFICAVVWERLPSSDGTRALDLTNDGRTTLLSDACTKCGAAYGQPKEICESAQLTDAQG
jgi:hypothetical protein